MVFVTRKVINSRDVRSGPSTKNLIDGMDCSIKWSQVLKVMNGWTSSFFRVPPSPLVSQSFHFGGRLDFVAGAVTSEVRQA